MIFSLLKKVIYRKKRIGIVQKNGKAYVKYTKVHRFEISKTVQHVILIVFILTILGLGFKLIRSEMVADAPVVESAQ